MTVHVEPSDRGERAAERVAAAALRVPGVMEVHNIAVLADGTRREVTMHARVAEEETLGGVEETLSRLRDEIAHDLSAGDVHIHLEPFAPEAQEAREVTQIESELAERATRAAEQAAGAALPRRALAPGQAPRRGLRARGRRRVVRACRAPARRHVEDAVREAVPILADVIVEVSPRTSART